MKLLLNWGRILREIWDWTIIFSCSRCLWMNTFAAHLAAPGNSVILQVNFAVLPVQKCLRPCCNSCNNKSHWPSDIWSSPWAVSGCNMVAQLLFNNKPQLSKCTCRLAHLCSCIYSSWVTSKMARAWSGNCGLAAHHLFLCMNAVSNGSHINKILFAYKVPTDVFQW